MWSSPRDGTDELPCSERIFGQYKNEVPDGLEMLSFTSLGPKNYFAEVGQVINDDENNENNENIQTDNDGFKFLVTNTISRCKGISLKRQNAKGLISKNLMRGMLVALAKGENKKIMIPQQRFVISKNTYQVTPQEFNKVYQNKGLLVKRLFNPKISLSHTYPIGAVSFYEI